MGIFGGSKHDDYAAESAYIFKQRAQDAAKLLKKTIADLEKYTDANGVILKAEIEELKKAYDLCNVGG